MNDLSRVDAPTPDVASELGRLLTDHVTLHRQATGALPRQAYEPDWISTCQVGDPSADGSIAWQPVRRDSRSDWSGVERALDLVIHPDVKAFYGTYWSESVPVTAEEGPALLIGIWNEDDHDRLLENVIGHIVAKRAGGAAPTVFFACTDEDDLTLSVDNSTGAVVLEPPGAPPLREIAPSLGQFLARLESRIEPDRP